MVFMLNLAFADFGIPKLKTNGCGLLHVLDYDHELGPGASKEMEEEETRTLSSLGWKGKGLISAAASVEDDQLNESEAKPAMMVDFGTLLNSKSMITQKTADSLRAAMKTGVQIIIATGKARPAAIAALETMGLTGEGGALSLSSPGVFLQGLQVYGKGGKMIQSRTLDPKYVAEAFKFSMEHQVPVLGFSGDRCVTLFSHTLVDELHKVFYEPKAEVIESIEKISNVKVQKVLFYDTAERAANFLRPHWSLALEGRATVVQSLPEMMEILPPGASKGSGVKVLLDHLGMTPEQVMAIGDGENDIEMLAMAGWGVAMSNGTASTKAAANAVTTSNDEDGVAKAIQDYILGGKL